MRIVPFLLALGLAAGSFAVPVAGTATPPPIDDGSVNLVTAPAFSGVLRAGQALQVTGTVTNSTGQDMDAGLASVYLPGIRLGSPAALSDWLDSDAGSAGIPLGTALGATEIGEVARGQVRTFTITIPAAALDLSGAAATAHPLAMRLASGDVEVDFARSAVVWLPDGAVPEVSVAVVTPLVAPPGTTGLIDAASLETLTAPGGLLDVQLQTVLSHPVAIGVDPMIIASIRILGSSAPQPALDWLAALAAAPNDIFSLGYADADPALAAQAGATLPLAPLGFPIDASLFPAAPDETPTPGDQSDTHETPIPTPAPPTIPTQETLLDWPYTFDRLAWPADSSVAPDDLGALVNAGYSRLLLDSSQLDGTLGVSPNVTLAQDENGADKNADDSDPTNLTATVIDDTLSRLVRTAATASTDIEADAALAAISAHLAVTASDQRGSTLVATLGRGVSSTGLRVDETLGTLESLPWVSVTSLGDALALPAARATFDPSAQPDDRVSTARSLLAAERDVTAFSSVVDDPTLVTGPHRLALLALLGQSWVFDQAGWAAATAAYLDESRATLSSVHIPEGSTITLLQEKGNLPIAVRNELPFPVTVYVTVQPERAILDVLNDRVELTIEANSQSKVQIPVQSIANGEVRTTVTLTSSNGTRISAPTIVDLNVQAGWETAATVVLAVVVIGLFGGGIWRTVLRRRKSLRAAIERDRSPVDPDGNES